MFILSKSLKPKPGFALLLGIVVVAILLILSASQLDRVANVVRFGSNKVMEQQAINAAEAGIEYSIYQLNENAGSWYGTGTEQTVGTTATFFTTVTDNGNLKEIISTGYIPNSVSPRKQVAIKAQAMVDRETIAFNYAVQIGDGGVEMENSATVNGNVYTNGSINGKNSSAINGDAFAVGTINDPPSVSGSSNPGSPFVEMPTFDYQFWKDTANINNDPITCSSTCVISSGTQSIGPQKYIGDLEISNTAVVNIAGAIYVTGNISILNSAQVNLDESFGSAGTVIIVDRKAIVRNSASINPTSSNPKGYILLVTTWTDNEAMEIENTGANALLYALEGGIELENQAKATALVAKRLEMENSANLTYDSGLPSAQFSGGPGGAYTLRKGSYQYTK